MLITAVALLAAAMAVLAVALRVVLRAADPAGAVEAARSAQTAAAGLDTATEEFRGRVADGGDR